MISDPARQVRRVAREVRARADAIARWLAALGLAKAIRAAGIAADVASDGAHSWVHALLDAGVMLVDITASQYGFTDVLVRLPGQKPPRWPRVGPRYRELYHVAVTGPEAEKLCQEVADEMIVSAPPTWWSLASHDIPLALLCAGTHIHPHRSNLCKRTDDDLSHQQKSPGPTLPPRRHGRAGSPAREVARLREEGAGRYQGRRGLSP